MILIIGTIGKPSLELFSAATFLVGGFEVRIAGRSDCRAKFVAVVLREKIRTPNSRTGFEASTLDVLSHRVNRQFKILGGFRQAVQRRLRINGH